MSREAGTSTLAQAPKAWENRTTRKMQIAEFFIFWRVQPREWVLVGDVGDGELGWQSGVPSPIDGLAVGFFLVEGGVARPRQRHQTVGSQTL